MTAAAAMTALARRARHGVRGPWPPLVGALLALAMAPALAADPDGRSRLARMAEAMRSVPYEGTFVYSSGDRAETMRVVHGVIDGESREHVSALNGDALELYRHGDAVVCILPTEDRVVVGHQPRGALPGARARSLADVDEYYRIEPAGSDRIAGREADEIRVEPVDEYRHGFRFWIDRERGFLLRSDLVTADGGIPERLLFTQIEALEGVSAERFDYRDHPQARGIDLAANSAGRDRPARGGSRVSVDPALPPGFELVDVSRSPGPPAREHAIYSDGLSTVSLFIERAVGGAPLADFAPRDRGALRVRAARVDGARVVVMGAVPAATLDYIVASLGDG